MHHHSLPDARSARRSQPFGPSLAGELPRVLNPQGSQAGQDRRRNASRVSDVRTLDHRGDIRDLRGARSSCGRKEALLDASPRRVGTLSSRHEEKELGIAS